MLLICICMPQRREFMEKQLEMFKNTDLQTMFFEPVRSLDDPRVASFLSKRDKKGGYLCTLSHTLCAEIASKRDEPTVIMEDDVALHKNFLSVLTSLLTLEWSFVSLGYLIGKEDTLDNLIVDSVPLGDGDSLPLSDGDSLPLSDGHRLGKSRRQFLFGTQCYIYTPQYAQRVWNHRRILKGTLEESLFSNHRHLVVAPLAIEDFQRFGTLNGNPLNANFYTNMMKQIKREDYYDFNIASRTI